MKKTIVFESRGEEDTFSLAGALAEGMKKEGAAAGILCLEGDLGCGKTVFAKGFCRGLGIGEEIISPTFTLVHSYDFPGGILHHFDAYRIEEESEMEEIGFEEYVSQGALCLIEWASRIKGLLPEAAFWIRLEKDFTKDLSYRRIVLEGERLPLFLQEPAPLALTKKNREKGGRDADSGN